jgi:hypothetical protein
MYKQVYSYQESFMSLKILTLYSLYIQEIILYTKESGRYITDDHIHIYDTRTTSNINTCIIFNFIIIS